MANVGLKKISFHLKYKTSFGQVVYIYGNDPLLGNDLIDKAIPMVFLNNDYWVLNLDCKLAMVQEKVTYHYFIQNPDGTRIFDWGNDKCFNPSAIDTNELILVDAWNFAGYTENVFYTEPFMHVLLEQPALQTLEKSFDKSTTHIFRVKAPLLESHHTICMIGDAKEVGAWNIKKVIPLTKVQNTEFFETSFNLTSCNFPFVYKYGVYDTLKKTFIQFEDGNNRVVYEPVGKSKLVILNDGFVHLNNTQWKAAGVAIPVFSLRSKHSAGVGEFADIQLLVDWSKQIGLKLIQLLPINDTTATHTWMDSYPYAAISAFALHPMFIRLEDMVNDTQKSILAPYKNEMARLNALVDIDYDAVMELKWKLLRIIYAQNGKADLASPGFAKYYSENEHWLVSYGAFSYFRDLYNTVDFNTWPTHAKYDAVEIEKLCSAKSKTYNDIAFFYFVQYHLHLQLSNATKYAHENGVVVKGDVPIGVYRYGADAWQHPELFHMNMQAGAPPDAFATKGQNWGFPSYNWETMAADGFNWWKLRFEQMSFYFDAFRIDHILGFFRIWSIPMHAVEGIMGHFVPAIPVTIPELNSKGIGFDHYRFTMPYINETILFQLFGYDNELVKHTYLKGIGDGHYELLPPYQTQRAVEQYFSSLPQDDTNAKIKQGLFDLITNVLLFESSTPQAYHFRFNIQSTASFKQLDARTQHLLSELYVDYFFVRQDQAWEKEALQKLPMLKRSTNMLICGEDLGLVPSCVPQVMQSLGMLSLEVQRMPKANHKTFFHPNDAPYLSVVTPSSHDTSTIRGWWEEDRELTQQFYNNEIGQWGEAPIFCEPWINKAILLQHLYSPAMWAIFQLQDYMGVDASIRRNNPHDERINVPANPRHYWRYRMHISLEDLMQEKNFNQEWYNAIKASGR